EKMNTSPESVMAAAEKAAASFRAPPFSVRISPAKSPSNCRIAGQIDQSAPEATQPCQGTRA
ncbi:MAG TPA: hypothetical protein VK857_03145, partial [Desulforhopalus sp.]|nr:hypothetical protein [Desulforhopalus sp.]